MKHPLFVLLSQSNIFFYATDEDECAVNNGGCSHKCLNTEGSYECVCPKGFKVQYNQRVCVGECIAWWNQQHRRIFFYLTLTDQGHFQSTTCTINTELFYLWYCEPMKAVTRLVRFSSQKCEEANRNRARVIYVINKLNHIY